VIWRPDARCSRTRTPLWCGVAALLVGTPLAAADHADLEPPEGHRLLVLAGIGLSQSAVPRDSKASGSGGFASVEYIYWPERWYTPRLYGGVLLTFADHDTCRAGTMCDVESQIVFTGAKMRLMAPIPWIGPFVELGLGVSAGYLRTLDGPDTDETTRGVALHIPLGFGVSVGERHQYDLCFSYLGHIAEKQGDGALAFGLGFALP
jgi:hypothetical protein